MNLKLIIPTLLILATLLIALIISSCLPTENNSISNKSDAELKKQLLESEVQLLETKKDSLEKMVIGLDSLLYDNEDFHEFFMKFVHDSAFSETRIIKPILYETRKSPLTDSLEILIQTLDYDMWIRLYRLLKGQDATNTDVYDNFELKGNRTNERVLHKYGLEQCGDVRYFFKGFEGKWKLVKVQQIGS